MSLRNLGPESRPSNRRSRRLQASQLSSTFANSNMPPPFSGFTFPIRAAQKAPNASYDDDLDGALVIQNHLSLLKGPDGADERQTQAAVAINEVTSAPLFTKAVAKPTSSSIFNLDDGSSKFSQYGLLGAAIIESRDMDFTTAELASALDPRIFQNVAAPVSAFICGSQGSGKSHTLSCMLENCLIKSPASVLPRPLTGLVFHYDSFVSDTGGSPCEAAYLASNAHIKVRVLCPPTNVAQIKRIYQDLPNVVVTELRINERDLNTKRMLDLMAFSTAKGSPLYLHVIGRILRSLRIEQQKNNTQFNYALFKEKVHAEDLTEGQVAPLKQRLETLESFMVANHANAYHDARLGKTQRPSGKARGGSSRFFTTTPAPSSSAEGHDWTPKAGQLTIIDLSCPCVTSEMACSLFNICLSLFLEQKSEIGRVIALDEAHKYMVDSDESQTLTEALVSTIRLQRHLGVRVFIATQEPTISPKLLDLCSLTIVHRFTSPVWLEVLGRHLAGASTKSTSIKSRSQLQQSRAGAIQPLLFTSEDVLQEIFSRIITLSTGEALVFSPTAVIGMEEITSPSSDAATGTQQSQSKTNSTPNSDSQSDSDSENDDGDSSTSTSTTDSDEPAGNVSGSSISSLLGKPQARGTLTRLQTTRKVEAESNKAKDVAPTENSTRFVFGHDPGRSTFNFGSEAKKHGQISGPTVASLVSPSLNEARKHTIPIKLGRGVLKMRIRGRVTTDGGRSIFAA